MATPKRLLFFVTEESYFRSHRLPLALAAIQEGYEVAFAGRLDDKPEIPLQEVGIKTFAVPFNRSSLNPWIELKTLRQIYKIYKQWRPDIVHQVAFKPILYGTLCARILKVPRIINAVAGLGILFTHQDYKTRIIRTLVLKMLRILLRHPNCYLIIQQEADAGLFKTFIKPNNLKLIPGAGVNINQFKPIASMSKRSIPQALMASRLLWSKGVGDLVEASRLLRERHIPLEIVLVGEPDLTNPDHIPVNQLQEWHDKGFITWMGWQKNIAELYQQTDFVVFPSYYGEGIPKTLIEAAACGKPILTTDHPGCREVVVAGLNGILVAPRNAVSLAEGLQHLAQHHESWDSMGKASRERAETLFAEDRILALTLSIYRD